MADMLMNSELRGILHCVLGIRNYEAEKTYPAPFDMGKKAGVSPGPVPTGEKCAIDNVTTPCVYTV